MNETMNEWMTDWMNNRINKWTWEGLEDYEKEKSHVSWGFDEEEDEKEAQIIIN